MYPSASEIVFPGGMAEILGLRSARMFVNWEFSWFSIIVFRLDVALTFEFGDRIARGRVASDV